MRLTELEPEFLEVISPTTWRHEGVSIDHADGIMFKCPKCFKANGGSNGTHSVVCWQPNVPQTIHPGPGRWDLVGTSFEDLSLIAIPHTSVELKGGCNAHFFVQHGEVRDA